MADRLSRLYCRIVGHAWELVHDPDPTRIGRRSYFVCTRTACRGSEDAWRWN